MLLRSFGGWKYHILLKKMKTQYNELRIKRDLAFFFHYWNNLQNNIKAKRDSMTHLLEKKDLTLKGASFSLWRKSIFRSVFHDTLHKHLVSPV
jgi:hypothetical protein